MEIKLYTISDDKSKIDKTLGEAMTESTVTFKEQVSVQDPIITIQSSNNLSGINYAYIERYGRYYFVNKVETTPNGLWQLTCHVDVLMSRAQQIKNLYGTITRSETYFNWYLNDNQYKSLAYRQIVTKTFPSAVADDTCILMTVG